jgi:hypothetical protein
MGVAALLPHLDSSPRFPPNSICYVRKGSEKAAQVSHCAVEYIINRGASLSAERVLLCLPEWVMLFTARRTGEGGETRLRQACVAAKLNDACSNLVLARIFREKCGLVTSRLGIDW